MIESLIVCVSASMSRSSSAKTISTKFIGNAIDCCHHSVDFRTGDSYSPPSQRATCGKRKLRARWAGVIQW